MWARRTALASVSGVFYVLATVFTTNGDLLRFPLVQLAALKRDSAISAARKRSSE